MKRLTLAIVMLAALCAAAGAQTQGAVDEEKRRDIVRLLELTRAADLGAQIIEQATADLRANFSMLPAVQRDKLFKIFAEEMSKEFTKERMIEAVTPIYDKYLSREDVKALITFYESPLGQRTVRALPSITREAYEDGARRGREAGLRVMSRVASEGLLDAPATAPPPAPKPKPRRQARRGRG